MEILSGESICNNESIKIELIYWLDARSEDAWTDKINMEVCIIRTVGFVIEETEDVLCVVSSIDNFTGQYAGILYIPKVAITSRKQMILA